MSSSQLEIIDWSEALQQCGDDEEFLRELLNDLLSETETQIASINMIIQNPQNNPFHLIMRAAHVIKGAAANMMCPQLRQASFQLEQAAKAAHEAGEMASPAALQQAVQVAFAELQVAGQNYAGFVRSNGI